MVSTYSDMLVVSFTFFFLYLFFSVSNYFFLFLKKNQYIHFRRRVLLVLLSFAYYRGANGNEVDD